MAEDDDDDDDGDGDGDGDRNDFCCGSALWIYFVGVTVCVSVTVKRVCVCSCPAAVQFKRNENVLHCIQFMQFFHGAIVDLSHLPLSFFPFPLLLAPPPLPHLLCLSLVPLHSQLATLIGIIDFDNRRQHRRTEPPPSPQQTLLSVCLICHFFQCALPPPPTTPSHCSLLQFLQFFLFFSPTFLAQAETQLAKFVCVCLLNIVRYLVPASIAYFPCLYLSPFPFLSFLCSFSSASATMAASVHFLTSMFIFNDLRFSGNLRKNM